jgi:hypothetical protein
MFVAGSGTWSIPSGIREIPDTLACLAVRIRSDVGRRFRPTHGEDQPVPDVAFARGSAGAANIEHDACLAALGSQVLRRRWLRCRPPRDQQQDDGRGGQ